MEMTAEEAPYVQQLSKYGSVQDRLRDWRSDVRAKINHFSCMQIAMLDIDGFRLDKALQMTADALADFSTFQRRCARTPSSRATSTSSASTPACATP